VAGNDPRFYLYSKPSKGAPLIRGGGRITTIANLSFVPEASCNSVPSGDSELAKKSKS